MSNAFEQRVENVFGPLVVNKQAALLRGLERTPRFVTEYLIALARSKNASVNLQLVRERIQKYSLEADRQKEFISRLMLQTQASAIALLEVEPRPQHNDHVARVPQLGGDPYAISPAIVEAHPELLYGGMWGNIDLAYDTSGKKPQIVVTGFTPYQLSRPDVEAFRRGRKEFLFLEWIDLMLTSAGYAPATFGDLRKKLLFLCRLVPLAQDNVNLVELGPRNTGKSYLLRNLSPRVYLLPGARVTPASMFFDIARNRVGFLGVKKVLVLDEINATQLSDTTLVAALLDYMESGHIARGGKSLTGDCSLLFSGNIDLSPDGRFPSDAYPHLFSVFPTELATPQIFDRLHGLLPGWELPKVSDQTLAAGTGFLSDYFGEVLTTLRRDPAFLDQAHARLDRELGSGLTIRDRKAIERLTAGMARLLFPDGQATDEEFRAVVRVTAELRARVHSQMSKVAPGEYRPKPFSIGGEPPVELVEEAGRQTSSRDYDQRANERDLVGVITLLFVFDQSGGGDCGFAECLHIPGKGFEVTGLHGKVLNQSVRASYDALLAQGDRFGLPPTKLRGSKMSVHLVGMAEPKDGPSAGLAFALAMLSAATGRPLRRGIAVTGELSLQGYVNPVGGIQEKLTAARARGRRLVLIPHANQEEVDAVPLLKEGIEVRPVRTLAEAVELVLV